MISSQMKLIIKGREIPREKIRCSHSIDNRALFALNSGTVYIANRSVDSPQVYESSAAPVVRKTWPVVCFFPTDATGVLAVFEDSDFIHLRIGEGDSISQCLSAGNVSMPDQSFSVHQAYQLGYSDTGALGPFLDKPGIDSRWMGYFALADERGRCRLCAVDASYNGSDVNLEIQQILDSERAWLSPSIWNQSVTERARTTSDCRPIICQHESTRGVIAFPVTSNLLMCRVGKSNDNKWQKDSQFTLMVLCKFDEDILQTVVHPLPLEFSDSNHVCLTIMSTSLNVTYLVVDGGALEGGVWKELIRRECKFEDAQIGAEGSASRKICDVTPILPVNWSEEECVRFSIKYSDGDHPVDVKMSCAPLEDSNKENADQPEAKTADEDGEQFIDADLDEVVPSDLEEAAGLFDDASDASPGDRPPSPERTRKRTRENMTEGATSIESLIKRIQLLEDRLDCRPRVVSKFKKQSRPKASNLWEPIVESAASECIGGFRYCDYPTELQLSESLLKPPHPLYGVVPLIGDLAESIKHYTRVQLLLDKPHPAVRTPLGGIHRKVKDHKEYWNVILDSNYLGHVSLHVQVDLFEKAKIIDSISWRRGYTVDVDQIELTLDDIPQGLVLRHLKTSKLFVSYTPPRRGPASCLIDNELGADSAALCPRGVFLACREKCPNDLFKSRDVPERLLSPQDFSTVSYVPVANPPTGTCEQAEWTRRLPTEQSVRIITAGASFVAFVTEPANHLVVMNLHGRQVHVERLVGNPVAVTARGNLLFVVTSDGGRQAANYLLMQKLVKDLAAHHTPGGLQNQSVSAEEFLTHEHLAKPGNVAQQKFHCSLLDMERSRHYLLWEGALSLSGYDTIRWVSINPLGMPVVLTMGDEMYGLSAALNDPEYPIKDFSLLSKRVFEPFTVSDNPGLKLIRRWLPLGSLQYLQPKTANKTLINIIRHNLGIRDLPSDATSATRKALIPLECGVSDIKVASFRWPSSGDVRHVNTSRLFDCDKEGVEERISQVAFRVPFIVPSFNLIHSLGMEDENILHASFSKTFNKLTNDLLLKPVTAMEHHGIYPVDPKTKCKNQDVFNSLWLTYRAVYMQSQLAESDKGSFDSFKEHAGSIYPLLNWETSSGQCLEGGDDTAYTALQNTQEASKRELHDSCKREFLSLISSASAKPALALGALCDYGAVETVDLSKFTSDRLAPLREGVTSEVHSRQERSQFVDERELRQEGLGDAAAVIEAPAHADPWEENPKKRPRH
eukprot:GHVH01013803.1.p2 GENE.GHVH01013803.1~~GHVH01013803.1.p2  ORF type:complete len:1246 (+),score=186.12 GHVH01013803.1:4756-8493(+)